MEGCFQTEQATSGYPEKLEYGTKSNDLHMPTSGTADVKGM